MYGLASRGQRFKTKKAVKEAITANPASVTLENTSIHGGYDGSLTNAPDGTYTFVGPDPYNSRKWYGNIVKTGQVIKLK